MTTTGERLTAAFAEGARQIDGIPDRLQREVGYAALRVDAEDISRRLGTRAPQNDLSAFDAWRANFTDGEAVVKGAEWLDKKAEKEAQRLGQEIAAWAFTGVKGPLIAGVGGVITGVVAFLVDWGNAVGFGVAALVLGGGVSIGAATNVARNAARVAPNVFRGAQSTANATLAAAQSIGAPAEQIITASVRPTVMEVSSGAAVTVGPSAAFIRGLRQRAVGLLYFGYGVLISGVLVFASGVYSGANEYLKCHPLNSTPTFSSSFGSSSNTANC